MMKYAYLVALFAVFVTSGCANRDIITKQEAYPKLYESNLQSILVVPAVNQTTAADAPDLYATTIAYPLAEAGYYVMSVPMVEYLLRTQGISEGEQLQQIDMGKFNQLFGADAVLFVTINKWDTNYYVTGGNVTVGADFKLVSTLTNETLWSYGDLVVINTSGNSGNLIADIISTAISTAITDYVPIARQINTQVVATLPVGKYHARHGKDGADAAVDKSVAARTAQ